jgi:2,3-dihydroxyethylbenzene 1,2-dioxygenase
MSKLTELGYIGISTKRPGDWRTFAQEVVGMEVVDEGEADRFYLRMDTWHHRFVVHTGDVDDALYFGWRVAGPPELREMCEKLDSAGIEYRHGSKAEARERRVLELVKLKDPAGHNLEIFYGPQIDIHRAFHPGRPLFGRFATEDGGLGHFIVSQPDIPAAIAFYELLGFVGSVEYVIDVPGLEGEPVFMHLNTRQHSLAFGVPEGPTKLNHVMLQYTDLRDLGITHDQVRLRQIPIAMHLGMHANDQMLSFYAVNPSGWAFEFGWGGCDAPAQQGYYTRDIWGHQSGAQGFGLDFDPSGA